MQPTSNEQALTLGFLMPSPRTDESGAIEMPGRRRATRTDGPASAACNSRKNERRVRASLPGRRIIFLAALLAWRGTLAAGAATVTVSVATRTRGPEISRNALGLSYETSTLLPDARGVRYFRPDNVGLVRLFRNLGVKTLRIGGNSVDTPQVSIPDDADIDSLFEFARAAGVKVIYSVRLKDGDPRSAAKIARRIRGRYADAFYLFAIGNEPTGYYKGTNSFLAKWRAIQRAMSTEWPGARFCGPDDNPSPKWCRMMVADFGAPGGPLVQITQHSYPFGCAYRNPRQKNPAKLVPVDAAAAREKMLSPDAYRTYERIYRGISESVAGTPVSWRLSEVNSFWFSGLQGASDRFVSALWAVDYLHWWVARGADGVNFHTGDLTGGSVVLPCQYAAFVTSKCGYEVRPLGYGMKLFSLGAVGRIVPASVTANANLNLVAYANLDREHQVFVTVVNKTHGPGATKIPVHIKLDEPITARDVSAIFLTAKSGDAAAGAGEVTLGGAVIRDDGSWSGQWIHLAAPDGGEGITITMPPASAAVVRVGLD